MKHVDSFIALCARNIHRLLFAGVLILFTLETLWLATQSAFPMAFDEAYHFGLTQFFAGHLNPVISAQAPDTYGFGNIAHNSSWLYHWLLSFPYRIFALSHSLYIEVVGLRTVNIGIALGSLLLLHKLLGEFKLSFNTRTFIVLLFAFTPVVTALSAQINYDNLLLLATLGAMFVSLRLVQQIQAIKPQAWTIFWLLLIVVLGPLVKFSFLPISIGATLVILVAYFRAGSKRRKLWPAAYKNFHRLPALQRYSMLSILLVATGLFALYYGQNIIRYHSLTPTCDQVLSVEACHNYYSWERNFQLAQSFNETQQLQNPIVYGYHWVVTSWYHLYGEIIPTGGIVHIARVYYGALLLLSATAVILTLVYIRQLLRVNPLLWVLLTISAVYILALFVRNYHDYRQLGEAVAVQGRYLIPILPLYYLLLVLGVREAVYRNARKHAQTITLGLAIAVMCTVLWFGGAVRYTSDVLPTHRWHSTP